MSPTLEPDHAFALDRSPRLGRSDRARRAVDQRQRRIRGSSGPRLERPGLARRFAGAFAPVVGAFFSPVVFTGVATLGRPRVAPELRAYRPACFLLPAPERGSAEPRIVA